MNETTNEIAIETITPENTVETEQQTVVEVVEVATNTLLIEERLDKIIALEQQQISTSLISVGLVAGGIVIFLLYKFLSNFFEF